jgi:3-deoxy-D-manno-octulosonate 8-phosphate phosphatase (KDO 8-P phosphatase)
MGDVRIQALILDVDGTLTDGGVWMDHSGHEFRRTSVLDGFGLRLWKEEGRRIAIWSGRPADAIVSRFGKIGLDMVIDGLDDKTAGYHRILKEFGLKNEEVCVMGDDLPDAGAMLHCGMPIAPANAVSEVQAIARYVTSSKGGYGAVREAVEWLLRREEGRWERVCRRYSASPGPAS